MPDEPELRIAKLPDLGEEWRAGRARQQAESRQRYRGHVIEALSAVDLGHVEVGALADAVLDALFVVERVDSDAGCPCSCHPHLPSSDFHDYGFDCGCRLTAEENRGRFDEWLADIDSFWTSPEGQALREASAREAEELESWLDGEPGVTVTSHGGYAPEQWSGAVDAHSFYFRERHERWRIELDLRPSGRFWRAWTGGDLDDDANNTERAIEQGDVIAEGTTSVAGYGTTPLERARFIAGTIRDHLRRVECEVHRDELGDLELLCGRRPNWCPACGVALHAGEPVPW